MDDEDAKKIIKNLSDVLYKTYLLQDELCFEEGYIDTNKIKKYQDVINILATGFLEEENIPISEHDAYKDAAYSFALENYKDQSYEDMALVNMMAPDKMPILCTQLFQQQYQILKMGAQSATNNKKNKKRDF